MANSTPPPPPRDARGDLDAESAGLPDQLGKRPWSKPRLSVLSELDDVASGSTPHHTRGDNLNPHHLYAVISS